MPYTPEQYYFDFSNDFCDPTTLWGKRNLTWGKGAAWDMEGFAHLMKMSPYPCYQSYREKVSAHHNYKKNFSDFYESGKDKLAIPYKFLQMIDPDAFKEIQQTHYHSVAHAVRNAADLSRACDIFFRAKLYNNSDIFYEWEARGATEVMYHFAKNSLAKSIILCGIDVLATGESHLRYMGGPSVECGPGLLGATYGCTCPEFAQCPPTPKQCLPGASNECAEKSNMAQAICADEPWPQWPSGNAPLRSGFPTDPTDGYRHGGYFIRKSYGGYASLTREAGKLYTTKNPELLINYAHLQNGFNYYRPSADPLDLSERFYTENSRLPLDPRTGQRVARVNEGTRSDPIPIKRLKHAMKINNSIEAKDFLYNGYGIVLSTNVGFSRERDSIGISYPDRIWYHTMAIIGYDDTRRLHPDCLFVIQNSWGDWNYGGHPDWGPLPQGAFLITGQHLDCILQSRPAVEQINDCNEVSKKRCLVFSREDDTFRWNRPPTTITEAINTDYDWVRDRSEDIRYVRFTCDNKRVLHLSQKSCERAIFLEAKESDNCGNNCYAYDSCEYRRCGGNQSPWGIAFALSFDASISPGFIRKDLRYEQFFDAKKYDANICVDSAVATGKSSWDTTGISKEIPSTIIFTTVASIYLEGTAIREQYGRIDCFIDTDIDKKNTYAIFRISGTMSKGMVAKFIINDDTIIKAIGETIDISQTIKLKPGRNTYSAIVDAGLNNVNNHNITFAITDSSANTETPENPYF